MVEKLSVVSFNSVARKKSVSHIHILRIGHQENKGKNIR